VADAMKIELTEEWCMNMAKIEARAAELHDGCQMPMEQARELAVSEASQDWYARGQDWGLADALTNGQSGDWVLDDIARAFAAGAAAKTTMKVEISQDLEILRRAMAAETEAALLRAALDQKHAEYEDLKRCAANNASNLALKLEAARRELAKVNNEFGSETADWPEAWRRVAEVKERAGRLWRDNETLRAALKVVVRDWTEQFERAGHLAPGWVKQAREALGPNVRANRPARGPLE
jgi:hypothetical protein